jgi:hypothetical protein
VSAHDRLVRAEWPACDRGACVPSATMEREPDAREGYWHGSASAEVAAWKGRALAAEARLAILRAMLRSWRPGT